jgi:hypothetical protein
MAEFEAARLQRLELLLLERDAKIRDLEERLFVLESQHQPYSRERHPSTTGGLRPVSKEE